MSSYASTGSGYVTSRSLSDAPFTQCTAFASASARDTTSTTSPSDGPTATARKSSSDSVCAGTASASRRAAALRTGAPGVRASTTNPRTRSPAPPPHVDGSTTPAPAPPIARRATSVMPSPLAAEPTLTRSLYLHAGAGIALTTRCLSAARASRSVAPPCCSTLTCTTPRWCPANASARLRTSGHTPSSYDTTPTTGSAIRSPNSLSISGALTSEPASRNTATGYLSRRNLRSWSATSEVLKRVLMLKYSGSRFCRTRSITAYV
ncbi:hypothetical protein CUR178_05771 [Leishmania enriettii]|uniref:Uncharacterized protein n=1 Tax=Leishmania enriettii TaxID=5663 RepID=A0A836GWM1_LEIEN|nr:hypothetical protein CUR178_05771 [Leishmania enriettii]